MNSILKNNMVNASIGFMVRSMVNAAFIIAGITLANLVVWMIR